MKQEKIIVQIHQNEICRNNNIGIIRTFEFEKRNKAIEFASLMEKVKLPVTIKEVQK